MTQPSLKQSPIEVIVVTYNNERDISTCLHGLYDQQLPLNILIVDNASSDATADIAEANTETSDIVNLSIHRNSYNTGYANGVNIGLGRAHSDKILILGPDTRMLPGSLSVMSDYLDSHPSTGVVAPQLILPDGSVQPSCRNLPTMSDVFLELSGLPRLLPKRFSPRWKMRNFDHQSTREVQQPEATCLLLKTDIVKHVGLMDTRFPMFFNDVDWCRRILDDGHKILFLHTARVFHKKGTSVYKNRIPMIWKSHQGFYRYFAKHHPRHPLLPLLGITLMCAALFRSIGCILFPSCSGKC